jgi:hypothetical protein
MVVYLILINMMLIVDLQMCGTCLIRLGKKWLCGSVATLLWPSVGVKPNTWKKLGLELSQP